MHKDGIQGAEGTEGTKCLEGIEGRDRALNIRKSIRRNNGEYSREDSKKPKVSRECEGSLERNAWNQCSTCFDRIAEMFESEGVFKAI